MKIEICDLPTCKKPKDEHTIAEWKSHTGLTQNKFLKWQKLTVFTNIGSLALAAVFVAWIIWTVVNK